MRISDWSSDVCSSDLPRHSRRWCGRHRKRRTCWKTMPNCQPSSAAEPCSVPRYTAFGGTRHERSWGSPGSVHSCLDTARCAWHTSELQSLMRISYAVFCLKKTKVKKHKQV